MRVLFFSFPYESAPGGGERYTEQTVEGLMDAGHSVTLISSSRALINVFLTRGWSAYQLWGGVEPVSKVSAAIFPLTLPFFLPLLALTLAFFRCFGGARVLVYLSLTEKLLATVPAKLLGMRVIWVEHLVAGRSLFDNPFRKIYVTLSRLVNVVTVSEAAAQSLANVGIDRNRISIIPPGIAPLTVIEERSPQQVVGAISRLSREKNIALLIRSFALVVKEVSDATLRVYGDGPEREALERLTRALGLKSKVEFFGHVNGAEIRYQELTVLAVPSARESFGLAALEAMNYGVPVVATRVGGLPELIIDGETGMLVPPEDELAMAGAIVRLLRDHDLSARLGQAGQIRAVECFSEKKMHAAWINLISSRS